MSRWTDEDTDYWSDINDPHQYIGSDGPAPKPQRTLLRRLGIDTKGLSHGEAGQILDRYGLPWSGWNDDEEFA